MRGGTQATLIAAMAAAVALAPAGSALAQATSRQSASVIFSEKATSVPTGATVKIRYRDPSGPAAKPRAVQRIVTTFAPGTLLDPTVPASCSANDARLMSEGVNACPPQSLVGQGSVTLDTGVPGGTRVIVNDLALLNNEAGELIMLTQIRNSSPPARAVVRGKIKGNTIVAEVPPIPGGAPDGFTAIRDVDFTIARIFDRIEGENRAYLSTPAVCPATRLFANAFRFGYRDGVLQDVPSPSPCAPPDRTPPRIKLAGVPRGGCARRVLRARVRVLDSSPLRRVGVRLNGRRLKLTTRRRVVLRIRRSALRPSVNRITITARDAAGNRARFTRRFARCR